MSTTPQHPVGQERRYHLQRMAASLAVAAIGLLPALGHGAGKPGAFPERMIQLTVPFPAGAATDYAARTVGQRLATILGVPVVVDNKTGASGTIAAEAVSAAPADGYHIVLGTVSLITHPALSGKPGYVPDRLVPLGVAVDMQLLVVTRAGLPVANIRELLAASAAIPGGLNAASPGAGTLSHLGWEILRKDTGTAFNHVAYRGSSPAMTDIMAGHADVMIESLASARPHLASGRIQPLAALTPNRLPGLPDLSTVREQGYPALEFSAWNAFLVPAGTPPEVMQTLSDALREAVQDPEVAANLRERGLEPNVRTPAEHLAFIEQETQRWKPVVEQADLQR